jgi:hypothetical protein
MMLLWAGSRQRASVLTVTEFIQELRPPICIRRLPGHQIGEESHVGSENRYSRRHLTSEALVPLFVSSLTLCNVHNDIQKALAFNVFVRSRYSVVLASCQPLVSRSLRAFHLFIGPPQCSKRSITAGDPTSLTRYLPPFQILLWRENLGKNPRIIALSRLLVCSRSVRFTSALPKLLFPPPAQ